jgi:hypothetical protein
MDLKRFFSGRVSSDGQLMAPEHHSQISKTPSAVDRDDGGSNATLAIARYDTRRPIVAFQIRT